MVRLKLKIPQYLSEKQWKDIHRNLQKYRMASDITDKKDMVDYIKAGRCLKVVQTQKGNITTTGVVYYGTVQDIGSEEQIPIELVYFYGFDKGDGMVEIRADIFDLSAFFPLLMLQLQDNKKLPYIPLEKFLEKERKFYGYPK
jgi:hypothetical protein